MGLTMQAGFIVFLCKANVRLANVNGHSHLNVMCTGRNAWRQPAVLPPTIICVHSSVCIAVLVEIRWWVLVKADTQHWTFSWTSGHDTWPDTIWWCALVNDFVCCWKVCPVVSFAELRVEWRSVCVDQNTIVVGGDHLLSVARWLLVRNIAPTVGQVQAWLAVLAIRAHIVQLTLINLKVGVLPHKGPPTTSDAFVHQAVSLQNERTRESTLTSSPPRKGRSLCQKWVCSDHFLLEAAWKKKDTILCACAVVSPWRLKMSKKSLWITTDRNGFHRIKAEGQIYKILTQIFQFSPQDYDLSKLPLITSSKCLLLSTTKFLVKKFYKTLFINKD